MVPLISTLDSKKKKNIIFKVSNPTAEPVAVSFSALKVLGVVKGKEQREATSIVQSYPSQFVLSPNETKSVRVRYMGQALPEIEEIYRVIAQELDIDVSDNKDTETKKKVSAQIKMRFSYEGLLFVHKGDAKAKIKIDSFNHTSKGINLVMSNSGNMNDIPSLEDYNYFASLNNKEYLLKEEDLKGLIYSRVLAGKTATYLLKNITSVPVAKITSMRLEKK
jgi:P pilus assembly chaperone PapD